MRVRRIALPAAVALVTAMTLAACAPGVTEPLDPNDSPLSRLFAEIDGANLSAAEREQKQREALMASEEIIATCMNDEGFEYTPVIDTGVATDEWKRNDREWVMQYGYGMFDYPNRVEDGLRASEDPNAAYVAGLGNAEQGAYYEALYGPQTDAQADGEWNWETSGCYGYAQHKNPEASVWVSAEAAAYNDAIVAFFDEPITDPRLDAANDAWVQCMSDTGFTGFSTRDEAPQSVNDAVNDYLSVPRGDIDSDPEFQQLKADEIDLALADLDCRIATDFDAKALPVYFEAEQRFIDENRAIIDAFLALAQGDSK